MWKHLVRGAAASAVFLSASAYAEDLMEACVASAEEEAVAEGADGCACLVDQVGDDQSLIDEILALGEQAPENRTPSDAASVIISECFPSTA